MLWRVGQESYAEERKNEILFKKSYDFLLPSQRLPN
jgi:hypothetical protein